MNLNQGRAELSEAKSERIETKQSGMASLKSSPSDKIINSSLQPGIKKSG